MKLKPSEAILYHMPSVTTLVYVWAIALASILLLLIEASSGPHNPWGLVRIALVPIVSTLAMISFSVLRSRRFLKQIAEHVEAMESASK